MTHAACLLSCDNYSIRRESSLRTRIVLLETGPELGSEDRAERTDAEGK